MAASEVAIVNMSLNRIGATTITAAQLTAATEVNPSFCALHYAQTRDALLRTHWWRFAGGRSNLAASAAPSFQWTYAWTLPTDFIRMRYVWDDNNSAKEKSLYSYELEGLEIFTNETPCKIKYTKKETTTTKFDPLFTEILVLQLAKKLVPPIAGVKNKLLEEINAELYPLLRQARTIDKQEQNTVGRNEADTWNDALYGGGMRDPTKLGSN